ncbi:MAG: DUF4089 domain-containing protein [Dehalococcoidia bacterium]|nr:DUF4089 domain-containing protein [Dehalococcoidia bacterium]MDW8119625.1 DUF4089 domain-containing protein [Chloroflexota bacterium]
MTQTPDLATLQAVARWVGLDLPPERLQEVVPLWQALRERLARLETLPLQDVEPAFIAPPPFSPRGRP